MSNDLVCYDVPNTDGIRLVKEHKGSWLRIERPVTLRNGDTYVSKFMVTKDWEIRQLGEALLGVADFLEGKQ